MEQSRQEGAQLIERFYNLLTAVHSYEANETPAITASEELMDLLDVFFNRDETYLTLKINRDCFVFQEKKLHPNTENEDLFFRALQFFHHRSITEIRFLPTEETITPESLHKIALFIFHSDHASEPVDWLKQRLVNEGLHWFDVETTPVHYQYGLPRNHEMVRESTEEYQAGFTQENKGETAKKIYAFALDSLKRMAQIVAGPNVTGIRKIQRMLQKMVDSIREDKEVFMAMSTVRDNDDYIYCHSVNVAILAMCFGQSLGLSKKSVEILGLCGLFHDLGKVDIPVEIIRKPEKLSHDETRIMEKHSLFSVAKILKMQTTRELKALILRSPLEHHIKYDRSGYPRLKMMEQSSFFGRILTIVDVYDAITSPRAFRSMVLSPDKALGKMREGSGTDFDPLLFKAFINMLGIYPMGTLLQLDTGEMGLVTGKGKAPLGNRPDVVVIKVNNRKRYVTGETISLEERDSQTQAYIRNIVGSFHPGQFGIQPAQFILG